jgi:hypothetical protein
MLPVLLLIASAVVLFINECNAAVRDRVADDVNDRSQNTPCESVVDTTPRTVAHGELLGRIPDVHLNKDVIVATVDNDDRKVHLRPGFLETYLFGSVGYSTNIDMNASHFYQYNLGIGALYQIHDLIYIGAEAAVMNLTATYVVHEWGIMFSESKTVWSGSGTGFSIGYSIRSVEVEVDSTDTFISSITGSRTANNALHATVGAVYQGTEKGRWYILAGMFQGAIGIGMGFGVYF